MNPAMIPMMVCQTVISAGRALLMLSPDTRWKWTEWGVSTVQSHHDQIHAFEVQRYNSQSIIIFCSQVCMFDDCKRCKATDISFHICLRAGSIITALYNFTRPPRMAVSASRSVGRNF